MIKEKTKKQRCLETWEWFADNPGKTKQDYLIYLIELGKADEFRNCWACVAAEEKGPDGLCSYCAYCPIAWPKKDCCNKKSPYEKWDDEVRSVVPDKKLCRKYALEVVELVETTWKEER